ncbi:MAG: hypothetical protein ACNS64_05555 [Candidatus Halalkalibacterium sp. M3_1C_030]
MKSQNRSPFHAQEYLGLASDQKVEGSARGIPLENPSGRTI